MISETNYDFEKEITINAFDPTPESENALRTTYKHSKRPILEQHVKYVYNLGFESNARARKYLGVTSIKWKMYASMYIEPTTNLSYYELFNQRLHDWRSRNYKEKREKFRRYRLREVQQQKYIEKLKDGILGKRFKHTSVKNAMLTYGHKEECAACGYSDRSISKNKKITNKVPLVIDHINEDYNDWRLDNLQFLCLNCYYVLVDIPILKFTCLDHYM